MSPDTKAGLAGWVLIIVGIAGVYALFKYPKQVLTASLIGFASLTALVLVLAGIQELKDMKRREEKFVTQYFETVELVDYLSNNPAYMDDEFITQWLRDWYRPNWS